MVLLISCGNAAGVTERQIMLGQVSTARTRRVYVQTSTDHGAHFGAARDITRDVKSPTWRWYATGPGHATYLTAGPHAGRIIVPADHSVAPLPGAGPGDQPKFYAGNDFYSDDDGRHWQLGFVASPTSGEINVNETSVTQLADGRVYFNARNQLGADRIARVVAYSSDGGRRLDGPFAPQPDLPGPVVEGSALSLPDHLLLFSGPADITQRRHLELQLSRDGGRSWAARTVTTAYAGYSDLVALGGDRAGVLYETGTHTSSDFIRYQPVSNLLVGT